MGRGARIAVIAEFKETFQSGPEGDKNKLLKLIPADGFKLDDINEITQVPSEYPGLFSWCRWIFGRTHNLWLDGTHINGRTWNREAVNNLSRDWPLYLEIDKQMKAFNSWLSHDTSARMAEVIRYVSKQIKSKPKKLYEVLNEKQENNTGDRLTNTL